MLQFIGHPEKQYCEKCAIKIAEQIGDEQEHFEQGYDEGICSECGKEYKSYYLVKESNIQGWTVKARYLGEFNDDEEAAEFAREGLGSSLLPNEFVLTEDEIRENYGKGAAELLSFIEDEGYIVD